MDTLILNTHRKLVGLRSRVQNNKGQISFVKRSMWTTQARWLHGIAEGSGWRQQRGPGFSEDLQGDPIGNM